MSNTIRIIQPEGVVLMPLADLKPYERNAKKHPQTQIEQLAGSFRNFGWRGKPIEITSDNVIINGHGRYATAQYLGLEKVPVLIHGDMADEEIRAYRIADNKTAESGWDNELLNLELMSLKATKIDLSGFLNPRDLEFLNADLGEMNIEAIATDISAEVEAHADRTTREIEAENEEEYPIGKVLGFTKVNATQRRQLALLLSHAEAVTQLTGADALAAFARDYVGLGAKAA